MTEKKPSQKNIERIESVCSMVVEGLTLREIAKVVGISAGRIIQIVGEYEQFAKQYTRAREAAADIFEADIHDAAMNTTPETAASDRVKIDALKWIAARRSPKRYGDKIQQDHTTNGESLKGRSLDDFYADVPTKPKP